MCKNAAAVLCTSYQGQDSVIHTVVTKTKNKQDTPTKVDVENFLHQICGQSAHKILEEDTLWLGIKMSTDSCILVAVFLLRRIIAHGESADDWKQMLLTAVMIAHKLNDDVHYDNQDFLAVYNSLTLQRKKVNDVNSWERNFLQLIDYKMHMSQQDLKYWDKLVSTSQEHEASVSIEAEMTTVGRAQADEETACKVVEHNPASLQTLGETISSPCDVLQGLCVGTNYLERDLATYKKAFQPIEDETPPYPTGPTSITCHTVFNGFRRRKTSCTISNETSMETNTHHSPVYRWNVGFAKRHVHVFL